MPNKKKNSDKPKKRSPAKRALRSAARFAAQTLFEDDTHSNMLTGLTDPFSDHAASARYPDAGAGSTLTQRSKATVTLLADPSGNTAVCFGPNFNYPTTPSTAISTTTVTWAAAKITDWSTTLLCTYGLYARPTSFGIRIVNTLSATDSAGYLIIAKGGPPVLGSTTTFSPLNFSTYEMHPFVHGGEWHVVAHPRSGLAYELSKVADATTTQQTQPYWESIYVGLFGTKVNSSPCLIEITANFEYTAQEDAPISSLAVPQPVLNVPMQTAINEFSSSHNGIHVGPSDSARNTIKKIAKKALVKHVLPFAVKKGKQLLL